MKVLVVEDDVEFSEYLQEFLTSKEFTVVTSRTVEQALGKIALGKFDVLLTDIQLPDFNDGISCITNCRKISPKTQIVAMSGGSAHIDDDQYFHFIELVKAKYVLKKPFKNVDLLDILYECKKGI